MTAGKKKQPHKNQPTPKHQARPLLYSIEIKGVNAAVPGVVQPQYISMERGGRESQRNALQVAKNGLKIKVGSDALPKHSTVIVTLTSGLNREYIGTFPAPYVMLPLPMVLSLSAVL